MSPRTAALAVDVGGTTIKGAVVAADGRWVRELARSTPVADGPEAVVGAVTGMVSELVGHATDGDGVPVGAVAVVVPGAVDVAAGRVVFAPNLGLRDVELRARLAAVAGGSSVLLEHDVRAAGVAERVAGAARGVDDHLVAVLGTGVAAVVHPSGDALRGARGIAGELGHIPVWPGGEPCPCGQHGCLERYASAASIARRYAAGGGAPGTSARDVAARRTEDPIAAQVWEQATEALAIGLVTCTMLLDPELIVLAGGLSEAGEALLAPVRAQLAARLAWREPPAVELSPLGARAGLVGAAVLAQRLTAETVEPPRQGLV